MLSTKHAGPEDIHQGGSLKKPGPIEDRVLGKLLNR